MWRSDCVDSALLVLQDKTNKGQNCYGWLARAFNPASRMELKLNVANQRIQNLEKEQNRELELKQMESEKQKKMPKRT